MKKTIICIGGGELRTKETKSIDSYIAQKAFLLAEGRRPYALFVPTASHDSMPYNNSFHRMYTGEFKLKTDVALTVYGEMDYEHIAEKFSKADVIYVGGGDTLYMLQQWEKTGITRLLSEAYNRGAILCGLSAGAICWFERMYTDSALSGSEGAYHLCRGLGWLEGTVSPHYNLRIADFDEILKREDGCAYAIEDNAAIEFTNGRFARAISSGGAAYRICSQNGILKKEML